MLSAGTFPVWGVPVCLKTGEQSVKFTETLVFPSGGRSHYRIPSVIATRDGTVLAFCNDRRDTVNDNAPETNVVCACKPLGQAWSNVKVLAHVDGWACTVGAAVYDENTGTAFCSGTRIPVALYEFGRYSEAEKQEFERLTQEKVEAAGVAAGDFLLVSQDNGSSWTDRTLDIEPYWFEMPDGEKRPVRGSCHGSGAGITLRHGSRAGRLLCPSRFASGEYHDMDGLRTRSFNNAIYSDDHGLTWKASAPVQPGTGEGTLMEDGEGNILYNSRAYYEDRRRYLAVSRDGGETYGDFRTDDFLLDTDYMGCNASLLRVERTDLEDASLLPKEEDSVTVFVNPRSHDRDHLTACISFDSGRTWAHMRLIHEGRGAYTSLAFNRRDQLFYLLYETGEKDPYDKGIVGAAFDLAWLLQKEDNG